MYHIIECLSHSKINETSPNDTDKGVSENRVPEKERNVIREEVLLIDALESNGGALHVLVLLTFHTTYIMWFRHITLYPNILLSI